MYIKSIKMQGFKSFADRLELDFSDGIVAIVGPNGSGKSNVVDAILWVLGEQSVKSLRGESTMSDIIFSGTEKRSEQKKASVAILFDNSDHLLNSPLNEVEIKRTIYKSGENEYFINNVRVRLKDITDLLIDVSSKFNIITQGNINSLVENKSSERRILFESAAGVLKYKKRKEESLRKLEGTNENLTRVNLIIKELLTTLTPLEEQKKDAEKYLEIKDKYQNIEISLIANDVSNYNLKLENLKLDNEDLQKKLDSINLSGNNEIEKLKLENLKLDEKLANENEKLNNITNELASLNSQKLISIERSKYNLDKKTIDTDLINLNEKKLDIEKNIKLLNTDIENIKKEIVKNANDNSIISDEELKIRMKISNLNNELNDINHKILEINNKIDINRANLENSSFLPKSVSSIINNPRLKGIHNTIGNVINYNDEYSTAINAALGTTANFIVCDNLNNAKEAINYLKSSSLGRATFFPIDTIKSRYIDNDTLNNIKNEKGFIGIASDIIKYDNIYKNIIENQLGNVLIVDNMDNLFNISKKTTFKYKMVTLEGEIVYPGGSITGGNFKISTMDKNIISKLENEKNILLSKLEHIKENIKLENENYEKTNDNLNNNNKKLMENRLILENKENSLLKYNNDLIEIENNISDLEGYSNNKIDDNINKLLNEINKKSEEKELINKTIKQIQNQKYDLNDEISEKEKKYHEENALYHSLENKIKNNEIEIGKYEVRIDNLLENLSNDYNITYEYAVNNYSLDMDITPARELVSKLKNQMKGLTNVNIGSIDEYNRLKKRYDFLNKQKDDLETSINELNDIICEMDTIMIEKFKTTFDKIASEFSKVFRIMFKGGNGLLKLTDENDLLNSGINIMAVPPGKKLNSTASLSGGEKALTAICLIFAILNVKPTPFIVLDEVEAALDEENVNLFGEYLANMKKQSQFILITHKKKMMEYADLLYGVTMQERGVSKLVSVKLENAN